MSASDVTSGEWVTAVARPNTPLFLSFLISGQEHGAIEAHTGLALGFDNIRRVGIRLQYRSDELADAASAVSARSSEDGIAFFEGFADRCLGSCHTLLRTADELEEEHRDRERGRELEPALARYFSAAVALGTFLQTLIVVQFELEATLRRFVAKRLDRPSDQDTQQTLSALQIPVQPTDELRNLSEMLELAALVQETIPEHEHWAVADTIAVVARVAHRHQALWDKVESYREHFGWMGRRYYAGDSLTAIDVVLRLQNLLQGDCRERLAEASDRRSDQLTERERAIERLGGRDSRRLADVLSCYMHLRSYRLDAFFIAHERVASLFDDVASRLTLEGYEDTAHLSWQELMDGLRGRSDKRELASRAAARRAGFEFISRAGETEWIPSDRQAGRTPSTARPHVLQGAAGWRGRFRGRVRVIAEDEDMLLMQPGAVLVATMTQPRLMLAVEKAGAIVTDEGGMLCHAVLVSREFNLPCVIGTERATHVLRDGDLVEVDGDAGVVRILTEDKTEPKGEPQP